HGGERHRQLPGDRRHRALGKRISRSLRLDRRPRRCAPMNHQAMRNLMAEKNFRWRGHEVSRIEGFSDAVFGFAVTLLVVSLEVPHSFAELKDAMLGFPAFGICFTLLLLVWRNHVHFFRRYGLQTAWASALNAM